MKKIIFLFAILFFIANTCSAFVGMGFESTQGDSYISFWPVGIVVSLFSGILFWRPWKASNYVYEDNLAILAILGVGICFEVGIIGDDFWGLKFAFLLPIGIGISLFFVAILKVISWRSFQLIVSLLLLIPVISWFVYLGIVGETWGFVLYAMTIFLIGNGITCLLGIRKNFLTV
jgi:hypothetical protein